MKWMCRIPAAVGVLWLLAGCLGTTTSIRIDQDGSGEVSVSYRISRLVAHLGAGSAEGRFVALPLEEAELTSVAESAPGVELTGYSFSEDTEDIVVDVSFTFDSPAALEALFETIDGPSLALTQVDGTNELTLRIYDGLEAPPDETSADVVATFFDDYSLSWEVTAPEPIESASGGEAEGERATVTFRTSDVVLSDQPIEWRLRW